MNDQIVEVVRVAVNVPVLDVGRHFVGVARGWPAVQIAAEGLHGGNGIELVTEGTMRRNHAVGRRIGVDGSIDRRLCARKCTAVLAPLSRSALCQASAICVATSSRIGTVSSLTYL